MGVQEALEQLQTSVPQQPLLFWLQDAYYMKVDRQAIKLTEVSCFADAVEFLLKMFYVLNLAYPQNNRTESLHWEEHCSDRFCT